MRPQFTQNEVMILECVRDGMLQREIAVKKNCGLQTVKNDVERIRHKLGVRTKTQMIVAALRRGIIELK